MKDKASSNGRLLTVGSLAGLAAGFVLGLVANASGVVWLRGAAAAIEPVGEIWVNALRMIVLPLIVSHLFVAIASAGGGREAGRIGAFSVVGFLSLLVLAAVFTTVVGGALVSTLHIDAATRATFLASAGITEAEALAAEGSADFRGWLVGLVPTNLVRAASEDALLGVVLGTVLFALASFRVAPEQRESLLGFFRAFAAMTAVAVRWILLFMPLGVFAIAFGLTAETGFAVAGVIGWFVLVLSGLLVAFTILLYPITSLLGRVPLRRFAWGMAPAQAVAAGSRSSLATLPALLDAAGTRLRLDAAVSAFVLPLAVSTFKVNRGISSPLKLIFLTHVYGIPLDPGFLLFFVIVVIGLSFSSPGIPSGGFFTTLPVYLAAGIPMQGIVLLKAVDAVPDVFKTVVNVTADMSVATVVARLLGRRAASHAAGSAVPASAGAAPATPQLSLP